MTEPLLSIDSVSVSFGAFRALSDVSFRVETNELVALIGPNGAGKTTLLNVLAGEIRRRVSGRCILLVRILPASRLIGWLPTGWRAHFRRPSCFSA